MNIQRDLQSEISELAEQLCPFDASLDQDFTRAVAQAEARASILTDVGGFVLEFGDITERRVALNYRFSSVREAAIKAQELSQNRIEYGWDCGRFVSTKTTVLDARGAYPLPVIAYRGGLAI